MNVPTAKLPVPTIANFNLAVPGGGAVTDHKMISKAVRHSPDMPMIIIKDPRVSLSSTAIVDDDIFPSVSLDTRIVDRSPDLGR